ncbi:MAG: histidine--tRNA ligase [Planctomycetales bacterium]|nr:histidine--tRNA ligase [Planctomycetales bacterium]
MSDRITPRTLKGFRDYPPAMMIPREWIIETARRVYRLYGFSPIDTPALEHLEILIGKGSDETDKQLYRFEDHGGRPVGMRFDLTVPLARFVAQNIQDLGTPFKRYHIANVWRGENTQRGRYREFMQCDFDTIGTTSLSADIEMVLVINDLLTALDVGGFTIHVNHRGLLNGLLEKLGLADQATAVLRSLDKLAKIGAEGVSKELRSAASATDSQIEQLLKLSSLEGSNDEMLAEAEKLVIGSPVGERGVAQLRELIGSVTTTLSSEAMGRIRFAPSICRGLDYYTGIVVETTLDDLPEIGSVASGGRYDNLANLFTSQELPGVGASLGLDRLLAALEELGRLEQVHTPAEVFLPFFDSDRRNEYLSLAARLRAAGMGVEFFPDAKKLGKQLQYANRRGFRVALILGNDEFTSGECQVKNLATGESQTVARGDDDANLIAAVRCILQS